MKGAKSFELSSRALFNRLRDLRALVLDMGRLAGCAGRKGKVESGQVSTHGAALLAAGLAFRRHTLHRRIRSTEFYLSQP